MAEKNIYKLDFQNQQAFRDVFGACNMGFTTSTQLQNLCTELFGTYGDYKGAKIDVDNYGNVTIALKFTHHPAVPGQVTAFTNQRFNPQAQDSALARLQKVVQGASNVSGYVMTKEGMEGLAPYIHPTHKDRNWNVIWNQITYNTVMENCPVSIIEGIDPISLLVAKFGKHENPGNTSSSPVSYALELLGTTGMAPNQVMKFRVIQYLEDHINEQGAMFGFGTGNDGFAR